MSSENPEKLQRAEVFYGLLFLSLLLLALVGVLGWRAGWFDFGSSTPPPVARTTDADKLEVVSKIEVEGVPYLLWSNGQVTPDMAAHRNWVLRTMAAQAILEKQTEAQPNPDKP